VLSHESQEQSERELLASMQHLEQTRKSLVESERLASLGGLVAGVAHEINTPVGITVSTASYLDDRTCAARAMLEAGSFDAIAQHKYLHDAGKSAQLLLSNAKRVAGLVRNFKRLAVDRISEERRRFDLREHFEETLRDLRSEFDDAGVEVRIDAAPGIAMEGYPVALAQVITNLAVNSLQHGLTPDRGGRIVLAAMQTDGDEVLIEYCDNGRGIEPGLRERVFEPFFTTNRSRGGSGLGLYIVNQIVTRQLDGSIVLEAGGTGGARFTVRIPRVARQGSGVGVGFLARSKGSDDVH